MPMREDGTYQKFSDWVDTPQDTAYPKDWTRVEDKLPPDGVVVDTISPGGMEQPLKRNGALWFFDDDSMYVYYTPEFWRAQ